MSLCPMLVSGKAVIMPEAERKDLLLDFLQRQLVVIPHPDVFFGFLIFRGRNMNCTVVMMSQTSGNLLGISFVGLYLLFP